MLNCCMLVKDRPKLTRQALETFVKNTDVEWSLVLIDDASQPETAMMLRLFAKGYKDRCVLLRNETSSGITAQVRNLGVYWSERRFGRGDWLALLDNDCYFTPGWASKLIRTYLALDRRGLDFFLLGGQNHPFHLPIAKWAGNDRDDGVDYQVEESYAVAGTCWLLHRISWEMRGPLVETGAPGPGQSEDADFCNKIRAAGGKVGAIHPPVVYDCGITQTGGTLSPGADVKPRVENVYYE